MGAPQSSTLSLGLPGRVWSLNWGRSAMLRIHLHWHTVPCRGAQPDPAAPSRLDLGRCRRGAPGSSNSEAAWGGRSAEPSLLLPLPPAVGGPQGARPLPCFLLGVWLWFCFCYCYWGFFGCFGENFLAWAVGGMGGGSQWSKPDPGVVFSSSSVK